MRVADLVDGLTDLLSVPDVADPRREARRIVADLLAVPGWWPALHGDDEVEAIPAGLARTAATKRAAGMPLAYVVGRAPFRHLMLDVDERVLIPRPETEMLIEIVLEAMGTQTGGTAIDAGTGSGAIALALAAEGSFDRVIGTDLSTDAIEVACHNMEYLPPTVSARVEFRVGSWLAPVRGERARTVVSNPPYIAYDEARMLSPSVREWEPPVALFTGDDGMAATATVIHEAGEVLTTGGVLALEVDERRAARAAELLTVDGRYTKITIRQDLTGRDRFVLARRRT